jgi:hypothetical protein
MAANVERMTNSRVFIASIGAAIASLGALIREYDDDFGIEQRVNQNPGKLLARFDIGSVKKRKPALAAKLAVQLLCRFTAGLARV